jgi:hypothetical protein
MRFKLPLLVTGVLLLASSARSAELLVPNFPLDQPLHVACLSPREGTVNIDVLDATGQPLARFERVLKAKTWQLWSVFEGSGQGKGALRVRLSAPQEVSLSGFLFMGNSRPFQPQDLPPATMCAQSCFELIPSRSPMVGRFRFSLPREAVVYAQVASTSKPPRAVMSESLGLRPAGMNSYDWNLVLKPPQGADHVGVFSVNGSPRLIVIYARVDK